MSNPKYASQTYVAPSPDVEVIGEGVLALLRNLHADDIAPFLKQYNLETVEPEKWYPMQLILDIEKAIVEAKINVSETLVAIGVKGMDTVTFVNVNSLAEAIYA